MLDIQGNVVMEGSYMVEAEEDNADFYQVRNGKPVLFAEWSIDILKTTSADPNSIVIKEDDDEDTKFIKGYWKKVHTRKQNIKPSNLYLVDNQEVIKLLDEVTIKHEISVEVNHILLLGKEL